MQPSEQGVRPPDEDIEATSPIVQHIIAELDTRDALELTNKIAAKHGVTLDELLGPSHRARPTRRHELWSRLHEEAIPTYKALGRVFRRDHTTIRAGIRRYAARCAGDGTVAATPVSRGNEGRAAACIASR